MKINHIIYSSFCGGYSCKRVNRHIVLLEIAGLSRANRIQLYVKSNRIIKGQIRVIEKDGRFEIHNLVATGEIIEKPKKYNQAIGVDKGYTEAFVTSDGATVGKGLGKLLTDKTERINKKNQKRQKLFAIYRKNQKNNPQKAERIYQNNLTRTLCGERTENGAPRIIIIIKRDFGNSWRIIIIINLVPMRITKRIRSVVR